MARTPAAYRPLVLTDPEPRAISVPLGPPRDPVIAEWFGQYATTAAGVNVTPDNCRKCAEVDACVGLIEDTVATVPLDFYERVDADHHELRDDNPLHQLLHDRPNAWQTSAEFRQMLEGWRNTHSNAYARIASTIRGPSALEPIHPAEMAPFRFGDSVAYRWSPLDGTPPRTLLQNEVLHLRDGPAKRYNIAMSESRIERHKEDIGLLMACGEYLARFFSNNATPKTAMKIPAPISDEASGKLREAWERRHRGLENQHRLAILDGGMDLVPIGMNNDDAQVVEVHNLALRKIARVFGVPLHLIGETSVSNFGTGIEQQSIGFISYYMRPKFVVWEQALNRALMSATMARRFYFEFNMEGLVRGDFKTRMEGYALQIQWGLATPNEIRKQLNLPPLPGGDDRMQPLNMAPASRIMDVLLRTGPANQTQRDQADQVTRMLVEVLAANAVRPTGVPLNGH